ncbi:Uridine 5'-monophosphate synthase-like Protein [Tribolium castaneum]|uniref:Uridine 5'-monophosphate synthase n=2 Tax=Tribolium castaneum TaxID=7070 RepID=D1ZZL8_TRICA|nr:Uridine 5'-monophosphate synthase-like Protein [Tribolium castaneum]
MSSFNEKLKLFSVELFRINAIKFGDFKTKVGLQTPVYVDLRVIVSYPKLLNDLADLILEYQKQLPKFNIICGVPYTALPIATVVSVKSDIPMVMRRKEAKDYGTKKLIEGQFNEGDKCLIIEDVVTSGSSILETVRDLKNSGINCSDAIVLLNREQGGEQLLEKNGIKMHALLTLTQLMAFLNEANCVNDSTVEKVRMYLNSTQVDPSAIKTNNRLKLPFSERAKLAKNAVSQQLFKIMASKKTTLCVAADVTSCTVLLNLAEEVGPHICLLKTHIDVLEDFHPNILKPLQEIADRHNFLLFEDRKFADIGQTVQLQYSKGLYQISSWASLVTAHSLMGKGVLDGLKQSPGLTNRGVFLLAQTSAAESLIDRSYVDNTVKLARQYGDLVTGVVCQSVLFEDEPGLVQLTPGVHLKSVGDNLSQQYNTPEVVVMDRGADVAVVGRGVTQAASPGDEARKYKEVLWAAYEKRINV